MFKQSVWMVMGVVAVVFVSSFMSQWNILGQLPSAYDPGVNIQDAFQTSETPLLVEFYSDDCASCRQATPILHHTYTHKYKDKLTLVMLDVTDSTSSQVAQLFGVESIPAVYVFDAKNMHKETIDLNAFNTEGGLVKALDSAVTAIRNAPKRVLPATMTNPTT